MLVESSGVLWVLLSFGMMKEEERSVKAIFFSATGTGSGDMRLLGDEEDLFIKAMCPIFLKETTIVGSP